MPERKHVGPDAASRYPVDSPVKLQLPNEPPEADFATTEIRHCIVNNMAVVETDNEEVDMAVITAHSHGALHHLPD